MKKIISGMFFRLFRGIEFWVLIVILLAYAFYAGYNIFSGQEYLSLSRTETNISRRFESSGISARDVYRMDSEVLPADVYYKIDDDVSDAAYEAEFVFELMGRAQIMPVFLILLFIPFFFGRLFSDGTVKNLISCGHSKAKIYMSALIVTFILDVGMYIINCLVFGFWCLIFSWKPPVYLPVVIPFFIVDILLVLTLSSVSIAFLFFSQKKTVTFIVGFVLAVSIVFSSSSVVLAVISLSQNINVYGDKYDSFRKVREETPYEMEQRFNFSEARVELICNGETYTFVEDSVLPSAAKYICLAITYMDPALLRNFLSVINPSHYLMVRDGLVSVNAASNIFWITVSTFCGIIVFKKREIRR